MIKTGVFIEGSYFCEECNREYDGEGTCGCGGEIKFISMHSNRYLSVWMKSRKAIISEGAKKIGNKNEIVKGEINMKKSVGKVIQEVAETLAQCDEKFIEEIANKVLTRKVKYIGDNIFEQDSQ